MGLYKKKILRKVQQDWGKETGEEIPFRRLEKNFVSMMEPEDWILDDQAWNDLEMNRVYRKVNRTFSDPGQQCMYNLLRIQEFKEQELKRRDGLITFFQENPAGRDHINCLLKYVDKEEYDAMGSLLFRGIKELPSYSRLLLPAAVGMLLVLCSVPFLKWLSLPVLLCLFVLNSFLNHRMNLEMDSALLGIRSIVRMLKAAEEIGRMNFTELEEYSVQFQDIAGRCRPLTKKMRGLGIKIQDQTGLTEYIQVLFLVDARAFCRSVKEIKKKLPVLQVLYRRLGELDAFQSMASVRNDMPHWCRPVFTEQPRFLRTREMGHLLLKQPICNSIQITGKNAVITGSNMSGKSTFLRTVGLNAVLAQSFYTVLAEEYETSFFNIMTSISPGDDIMEGASYYLAEAKALLRMLERLMPERSALLIIDEIFRGTNPTERVAGASSLLTYMGDKNCLVMVATHDIQITAQVKDQYDRYHFEETVTENNLQFDYKLKPGDIQRPNGIRILQYLGYPREIISRAMKQMGEAHHENI